MCVFSAPFFSLLTSQCFLLPCCVCVWPPSYTERAKKIEAAMDQAKENSRKVQATLEAAAAAAAGEAAAVAVQLADSESNNAELAQSFKDAQQQRDELIQQACVPK